MFRNVRPSPQTLVGILQQQIQSNHEALSSVHAAAVSEDDEKGKGEEMEADEEERPSSALPPSSPPPLTSLLDSETGKMLPVMQDGGLNGLQAASAKKSSSLEEAVERMKAATSDGVKSPEEVSAPEEQ